MDMSICMAELSSQESLPRSEFVVEKVATTTRSGRGCLIADRRSLYGSFAASLDLRFMSSYLSVYKIRYSTITIHDEKFSESPMHLLLVPEHR